MTAEPVTVISSDGHVSPEMEEYRDYVEPGYRESFERFLVPYKKYGYRSASRRSLETSLDQSSIDEWAEIMLDTGRWENFHRRDRRLAEAEREGVAAEVLFPDTGGTPFQFGSLLWKGTGGSEQFDTPELEAAGMRAYNRWLVDYMSLTPERYCGQAMISWHGEADAIVNELRWARQAGLRGVILPKFAPERPLFHPDFEPVWDAIEDLGLVVNCHTAISSTSNRVPTPPGLSAACTIRVTVPEHFFYTHNILSHLIWSGLLERHPGIRFVFTEQGSGWVVRELETMDYSYSGSYFRADIHDVIRHKPSEYFERQCYLGSSILARVEVAARHEIGLDKMMIGMDMPHHEGMLIHGVREYLKATLGAESVPEAEARMLLGQNAARVFGFDLEKLAPVARAIGLLPADVLTPPAADLFPRGDVHKPSVQLL